MAIRNMLHMSQLKAFEEFLESKGYLIIPTVGAYEVLRARKPKENMVIVYRGKQRRRNVLRRCCFVYSCLPSGRNT